MFTLLSCSIFVHSKRTFSQIVEEKNNFINPKLYTKDWAAPKMKSNSNCKNLSLKQTINETIS